MSNEETSTNGNEARCSKCGIDDGRHFERHEALVRDDATGEIFCAFCADEICRLVHGEPATIRHNDGSAFSFTG